MAIKFPVYGHQQDHTGIDRIDKGRYEDTGKPEDKYIFKVPQLRNVEMTHPYFHSGSVNDIEEAIRIMGSSQLNTRLEKEEVSNMAAFLRSLTGKIPEHGLE
jgi:cytochrome c peroxidase